MILSVLRPPYQITPKILQLVSSISQKLGQASAFHLEKPGPVLRKKNRIRTIQSSLQIEGNTLNIDQVTGLIDKARVLGPKKDILEVENAIAVYDRLANWKPTSESSFLKAQGLLLKGLSEDAGRYRQTSVGIVKGDQLQHVPPPAGNVPALMKALFMYLKKEEELLLIKAAVFHYELEFIHPFSDGNGRMGRLWQSLILQEFHPVFQYLSIESIIAEQQQAYYQSLSASDKLGRSNPFIEYMLQVIDEALELLLAESKPQMNDQQRMEYFLEKLDQATFSRKEYLLLFKGLSTASASRDLQLGIRLGWIERSGDKRTAIYRKHSPSK